LRVDILQKIEGEAFLRYRFKKGRIEHVKIEFPHYRGVEEIMRGRPAEDAVAIAPRVCGICGHSHLIAAAEALENAAGVTPPLKARYIRNVTLGCELIQNHIKWLYLVILPLLKRMGFREVPFFEAIDKSATAGKIIAIFGGQYPHTSYAVLGGVCSDPTLLEIQKAKLFAKEIEDFFHSEVMEEIERFSEFKDSRGILKEIYIFLKHKELLDIGRAHDRFLNLREGTKILGLKRVSAKLRYVSTAPSGIGYAKNALYKGKYFEVGPLARRIHTPFVKDLHRRYKDGLFTRIAARVYEIKILLSQLKETLKKIEPQGDSFVKTDSLAEGTGEAVVEAPRGSLIHRVKIKKGKIERYEIITPTQFNLSNGTSLNPGPAQKAVIGLRDRSEAELVFRSFDICSVCTTH